MVKIPESAAKTPGYVFAWWWFWWETLLSGDRAENRKKNR